MVMPLHHSRRSIKALEADLAYIKAMEKELAERYASVKDEIFLWMDEEFGRNKPIRYTSPQTKKIIERYFVPKEPLNHPKLDVKKLQSLLTEDQWESVTDTERILNQDKLASLIEQSLIPRSILQEVTSYPTSEPRLAYREPAEQSEETIVPQSKAG